MNPCGGADAAGARRGLFQIMTNLAENLERLEEAIVRAFRRAGRSRNEIELMAVSKTCPAAVIAEAAALGVALFGENRVQEFAAKALHAAALRSACGKEDLRVHLIGHLNRTRQFAPWSFLTRWIHWIQCGWPSG